MKLVRLQAKKVRNTITYTVTLPKEYVEKLGWKKGDFLVIDILEDKKIIVIYRAELQK